MINLNEFLVNKRINKKIDQKTAHKYFPQSKSELI